MQKIFGFVRKAVNKYELITNETKKIAVGVSGGKDSLILLRSLCMLRDYLKIDVEIIAIFLDLNFKNEKIDVSKIKEEFEKLNVKYVIKQTNIAEIVFEIKKEKRPCSLCSTLRKGILVSLAKEQGCTLLALGHHMDDFIETFFLNLFNEGRIGCFAPKTFLTREKVNLIRPLAIVKEKEIVKAAKKENFPIVGKICPMDGNSNRQQIKNFVNLKEMECPGFRDKIFGAIKKSNLPGWN